MKQQQSKPVMAAAAATARLTLSCLLLLMSGTLAASEGQLQVLSEVVSGPAHGRLLALHLDPALPPDVQRAVVDVEAVRRTPRLTFTLDPSHSRRQVALPGGSSSSSSSCSSSFSSSSAVLHVVLLITPQPELLQALWLHWKPRNLLLFSLGPSPGTDLLRHEALSSVEKVALIGHLPAQADPRPDALGVYTVLPFSSSGVRLLGPWRRESFASWEALFPDRFSSFEGYSFHIAPYVDYPPFLYRPFTNDTAVGAGKYGRGVGINIFEAMSEKLNYTYTITEMVGKWGAIENGSWVGILGTMARKEKNFTISGFYITEERISGFDASATVGRESSSVFVPSPKPLPEWLSIVRPFNPSTWASFLAIVAVAVFSMASMERVTARHKRSPSPGGGATIWQDLPRSLVSQSIPIPPEVQWQRVFVAVWFLGCLVATAAYTCNLVSIFTSITYPRRLCTLQDLADSHYRLALLDNGGYTVRLVKESEGPLYRKMRRKLDLFTSIDDAVTAMKAGDHAIVAIESSSRFSVMRQMKDDEWYIMEEKLFTGRNVWMFQKNTPWQHKFDENIQRLQYFGLIEHWYKVENMEWITFHLGDSVRRGSGGDNRASPLTLRHLQGVFSILGLAWMAGGTLLLLELLTHRHKDRLAAVLC